MPVLSHAAWRQQTFAYHCRVCTVYSKLQLTDITLTYVFHYVGIKHFASPLSEGA